MMNKKRKKQTAVMLGFLLVVGLIWNADLSSAAAKPRLSQTRVTLTVGKSKTALSCKVTVKAKQTESPPEDNQKINITVGNDIFEAELQDNRAARELRERLPMTITMDELNGNEKFYYMDKGLPQSAESVRTIHTGDLMLFGSDCLVLFYEDFRTSYSYTRLGKIKKPDGLARALGRGNVKITFSTN